MQLHPEHRFYSSLEIFHFHFVCWRAKWWSNIDAFSHQLRPQKYLMTSYLLNRKEDTYWCPGTGVVCRTRHRMFERMLRQQPIRRGILLTPPSRFYSSCKSIKTPHTLLVNSKRLMMLFREQKKFTWWEHGTASSDQYWVRDGFGWNWNPLRSVVFDLIIINVPTFISYGWRSQVTMA